MDSAPGGLLGLRPEPRSGAQAAQGELAWDGAALYPSPLRGSRARSWAVRQAENPQAADSLMATDVTKQLGHVDTAMVIRHYYRFVKHNTCTDGSAFDKAAAQFGL